MKKTAAILTLMLALTMTSWAQIFLEEGEANSRSSYSTEEIGIIPHHQVENDQANYVPTGSGIILLTALSGAYLLRIKKTNK